MRKAPGRPRVAHFPHSVMLRTTRRTSPSARRPAAPEPAAGDRAARSALCHPTVRPEVSPSAPAPRACRLRGGVPVTWPLADAGGCRRARRRANRTRARPPPGTHPHPRAGGRGDGPRAAGAGTGRRHQDARSGSSGRGGAISYANGSVISKAAPRIAST